MKYVVRSLLLSLLFVAVLGCDKATPVAPKGTTITLSANPSEVTSTNGTSTITAIVLRENGLPVNQGTEVRFETTMGTIDQVVETNSSGIAVATLRGDGRLGKAQVRASSGSVRTEPLEVTIGRAAKTITLQATPTNIPSTGNSTVRLLALVRDSRGQPLANAGVNFQTEYGTLNSGGRLIQTNAQGEARDTLTVRSADLANDPPNVTVRAQTTDDAGGLVDATFEIQVRTSRLDARFTWTKGAGDTTAVFNSTVSGGSGQYRYSWDFGDDSPTSSAADPTHTYPQGSRTYFVTLTVTDSQTGQSDVSTANVAVPVTSGSSID